MKESEANERLARRRVLMQNLLKLELKDGYLVEYFTQLPNVFMQFDYFTCKMYLQLMPTAKAQILIEEIQKVLKNYHLAHDEEQLLVRKMATLNLSLKIK